MNKVLFYIDFLSYRERGMAIEFGPVPQRWGRVYSAFDEVLCGKLKDMTSRAVSELSHKETAWKAHVGKPETIPFSEAFSLMGM